ncbi:FCD domain-containing protein [Streptomyces sp. NPDC020883]|uniref:FCD domain-containing protein n=1 Tax=Streptomyces sp. NPDC020883 TaxID=3365099 RepID=UPI00378793A2
MRTALVDAAHNPVLTDLFGQFAPALRQGLIVLVPLLGLRDDDPHHGDARHAVLVDAVAAGDADTASTLLPSELAETRGPLLTERGGASGG